MSDANAQVIAPGSRIPGPERNRCTSNGECRFVARSGQDQFRSDGASMHPYDDGVPPAVEKEIANGIA